MINLLQIRSVGKNSDLLDLFRFNELNYFLVTYAILGERWMFKGDATHKGYSTGSINPLNLLDFKLSLAFISPADENLNIGTEESLPKDFLFDERNTFIIIKINYNFTTQLCL